MGTYSEYAYENEPSDLEEMPISIITDLEQYKLSCAERVHGGKSDRGDQRTKEGSPHCFDREIDGHFF